MAGSIREMSSEMSDNHANFYAANAVRRKIRRRLRSAVS